ncbi:MAG: SDR family oxidoreductase, partial [Actinomycetota bacterium]|nr:SDR family oxidoreductase [Actinomycetota bacterium]
AHRRRRTHPRKRRPPGPLNASAGSRSSPSGAGYAAKVPMKRLGRPDEIANAATWLIPDEASFVTGVVLPVDGGTLHA